MVSGYFRTGANYINIKVVINQDHIEPQKPTLTPFVKINVNVKAGRKNSGHIFQPFVYTLEFSHGLDLKWTVVRSYKEIRDTHKKLVKMSVKILNQFGLITNHFETSPEWALFPTECDHLVSASQIDERCGSLAEYLERILDFPPYRNHPAVLALVGVSFLSFETGLGRSIHEGELRKRRSNYVNYGPLRPPRFLINKVVGH